MEGEAADAKARGSERYLLGCILVLLAGAVLSLGAFCLRLADGADTWQYIFWRSLAFTGAIWLVATLRDVRGPIAQVRQLEPIAWVSALFIAGASITFIASAKTTILAETFFICSLAPLISAALAGPLLGERIGPWTLAALAIGLFGVLLMVVDKLEGGAWGGRLWALASALSFAGYSLTMRRSVARDRDGTLLVYGVVSVVCGLAAMLATGVVAVPRAIDAAMAMLHGSAVLAAGMFLFGQGSRYVSAVTFTMLAQTEAVLSALWGFLFFNETPTVGTLMGGGLILAAVVVQAFDTTGAKRR